MVEMKYSMPKSRTGEELFKKSGEPKKKRRRRRRSPPPQTSTSERNKFFEQFRKGEISKAEAIGKIVGTDARRDFESRISKEEIKKQQEQRKREEQKQQQKQQQEQRKKEEQRKQQAIILKRQREGRIVLPRDIQEQIKIEETLQGLGRKETKIIPPTPFIETPEVKPDVPFFLGEKELRLVEQPAYGTIMDTDIDGKRRELVIKDISPDYTAGIIRKVEEYIPGAGVVLTSLDEEIYLPDKKSINKYRELISSKKIGAGKDIRIFLRDQQAQQKKDLGKFNLLTAKGGENYKYLSKKESEELQNLANKLNKGDRGTGWQLIAEVGRMAEKQGDTVKILGYDVSPEVSRGLLAGSVQAYKTARDVALFQAGAGAITGVVGSTGVGAKILQSAVKLSKPLKYAVAPAGFGIGVSSGVSMYGKTKDMPLSIGAGVGGTIGFFGSAYSKEIFDAGGKLIKGLNYQLTKPTSLPPIGSSKRAEMNLFTRKGGSKYAKKQLLKYQTEKGIDIKKIVKEQAFDDFVKYGKNEEVKDFLKKALKKLSKMDVSLSEKQRMAKNLMGRIAKAKGEIVITDASGNVVSVQGASAEVQFIEKLPTDSLIAPTRKPIPAESLLIGRDIKKDLIKEEKKKILFSLDTDISQNQYLKQATKQATNLISGVTQMSQQDTSPLFDVRIDQRVTQKSLTTQKVATITKPSLDTGMGNLIAPGIGRQPTRRLRPRPPRPKPTKPLKPIKLKFDFEKAKTTSAQGYNVKLQRQATGINPYWEKLNPKGKAFDYRTAKDVGAEHVDREISARYKLEKVRETAQTGLNAVSKVIDNFAKKTPKGKVKVFSKPTGYASRNARKFRQYKQKRGAKTMLRNEWIEKRTFRLDSKKEISEIQKGKRASKAKNANLKRNTRKKSFARKRFRL